MDRFLSFFPSFFSFLLSFFISLFRSSFLPSFLFLSRFFLLFFFFDCLSVSVTSNSNYLASSSTANGKFRFWLSYFFHTFISVQLSHVILKFAYHVRMEENSYVFYALACSSLLYVSLFFLFCSFLYFTRYKECR